MPNPQHRHTDRQGEGETEDKEMTGSRGTVRAVTDPALAKALSIMTSNIIKVIDEKLSPLTEIIHKDATELRATSKWLGEAEDRLLAVENSATAQEPRIEGLEKQVSTLTGS